MHTRWDCHSAAFCVDENKYESPYDSYLLNLLTQNNYIYIDSYKHKSRIQFLYNDISIFFDNANLFHVKITILA